MTPLPSQTDYELLQMYSRGSQPAFAELVRRHVDWVYSAAGRQVRDPHLAEDVTQAVFLILSQKAPSFGPAIILPAWLHRAARYCAANALRAQNVRRHHESRAAEMAVKQPDQIGTLDELIDRPQLLVLLDRAIGTLGGTDQKAIVLHYFQGKTHADVAVALGLSSDAASKRIQRALTKLHGILARSGQPTNMASLAAGVLARATRPAPAHLAGAIASNIAGKTAALQVSLTIANKAVKGMFWSHLKAAAAIGMLAIAATAGISSAVVMLAQNDAKPANPAAPAGAAAAQAVIAAAAAIPPAPARATAVIVSVVDADGGGAIAGASVSKLISGAMSNAYSVDSTLLPIGTTDAAGQISLTCDPAERTAFLVTAKGKTPHAFGFWGCVPDAYQVSLAKPLHTFGGQVLDDAGKPIADAPVSVRVYDFQLAESANRRDVPLLSYPLSARTDSSGRFSLAAPDGDADGVSVQISREWVCVARQGKYIDAIPVDQNLRDGSFVGHPLPTAPPFAPPHVTTPPPVTLHMRVLDADTGKPILHYRVTPGGSSNPTQLFQAMPGSALEMTRPEVTWTFYDGSWSYFLRVEADGYAATPTRMVRSSEKQADLEVKLNRAFPITVTVRTPRGEPAAGAVVYLATPTLLQSYVTAPGQQPLPGNAPPMAVADGQGMFKFSPPGEPYRLAIAHADGCAEVTGNTFDQVVTLTPWGSIDLTVFWDGKPLSNTPVGMQSGFSSDANCHIDWGGNYTTNADGHVVISAWRPGQIFSDIQLSDPNGADVFQTIEVSQRLKAGEHIELRLLTGKTTIRCALEQPAGSQWGPMTIQPFGPAVNLPADINQMPAKDQIAAVRRAQETAIDPKARESAINFLYISPHADGAIEVMGLKPGTYLLSGFARPIPTADGQAADASPVQRLQRFFSVPSSQPPLMDLGVVSLNPAEKPALNIGDSIPDLAIADLDGKPFSLSALRGKWVLLDFWGTWCGFSIADEPALMDAYDGWADDGRLAMVSASVVDTPEQVRKHIAAARIPWRQLVLGPHDKTAVPRAFGVDGYPTIMLISPEGKLIETNLRGQSLRDALLQNVGAAAGAK